MPREFSVEVVERVEVTVMFRRVVDEQSAITRGWVEFEQVLGSLRGRKFDGAADEGAFQGEREGEYRICVQVRDGDDAAGLGLELGTLPAGLYARVRLLGQPPGVYGLIAPAFERLAARPDCDRSRPVLEFYRRHDLIELFQPIS